MNCPACGAPMRLKSDMASFKCEYCQSVYFPEKNDDGVRVLDEPSEQACPVCSVPLMNATIANLRILYCTQCRGMLIPMQFFEEIVEQMRTLQGGAAAVQTQGDSGDLRRKIDCPHCHHRMDAHFYAGPGNVVIDSCDPCCLNWLDHGELMRIVRAVDDRSPAILSDY